MALVLADSKDERVPDALIRMIQRPDLKNRRGTLVYALGSFDCSRHFDVLVQLIVDGNFEVSHEALYRIEEIDERIENTAESYALLLSAEPQEEWRRDLIQEALAHFS